MAAEDNEGTEAGVISVEKKVTGTVALNPAAFDVPEIPGLRPQLVCPGDVVSHEPGSLVGKGMAESPGGLVATVCGVVERVNKLIYVRPLNTRYLGSVGDVVVGRIAEVQTERWSVKIGSALAASLNLGSIHLPGNVQRRRTDEDALRMREFYEENDIISAEVQRVGDSGDVGLQTRTARYGKLQNGVLVTVPPVYVPRQAQHFATLPNIGVMVVLGCNGWIWVCAPPKVAGSGRQETINFSQMDVRYAEVPQDLRERICRVRNSILALAAHGLEVTLESIPSFYELSVARGLAAWELVDPVRVQGSGVIETVMQSLMRHKR